MLFFTSKLLFLVILKCRVQLTWMWITYVETDLVVFINTWFLQSQLCENWMWVVFKMLICWIIRWISSHGLSFRCSSSSTFSVCCEPMRSEDLSHVPATRTQSQRHLVTIWATTYVQLFLEPGFGAGKRHSSSPWSWEGVDVFECHSVWISSVNRQLWCGSATFVTSRYMQMKIFIQVHCIYLMQVLTAWLKSCLMFKWSFAATCRLWCVVTVLPCRLFRTSGTDFDWWHASTVRRHVALSKCFRSFVFYLVGQRLHLKQEIYVAEFPLGTVFKVIWNPAKMARDFRFIWIEWIYFFILKFRHSVYMDICIFFLNLKISRAVNRTNHNIANSR